MRYITTLASLFIICFNLSLAQRAKDGDYTVTTLNEILNEYTTLSSDASSGAITVDVANNSLNNSFFGANLAQGDLVLIIQMKGVDVDISNYPTVVWGGTYTVQTSWFSNGGVLEPSEFGAVTNYNNAGNFEYKEVQSVSGTGVIEFTCPLTNNYTANRNVQVIRVPRINNLIVSNNTSVTCPSYNGVTGGIVALEVESTLNLNGNNARIDASENGFRGGQCLDNVSGTSNATGFNEIGYLGSIDNLEGAEKGESVAGDVAFYVSQYSSQYGLGAIANGGGGGNYHNSGGGGGSNVGTGTYTGDGNPSPGNVNAWNEESLGFATSSSSGGGRGGYSHSTVNLDATTTGPFDTGWGVPDSRRNVGGKGGHALTLNPNKLFFGGGGGAGDQNDSDGGDGGNGGGIVFITSYGLITGNGVIEANGEAGGNAEGVDVTGNFSTAKSGDDGAGGGGGGGSIFIQNTTPIATTVNLEVTGGDGGDQVITLAAFATNQANGPGGSGAGGLISISSGTPTINVLAGAAGTTNSSHLSEFTFNGATNGASGISSTSSFFDLVINNDTICNNTSTTLTATVLGSLPSTSAVEWYTQPFGGTSFHTGLTYTTPNLINTTIYFIGICPGTFRIPVTVVVGAPISFGLFPSVTDETCAGNDGSVENIFAFGGIGGLTFDWNGSASATDELFGVSAGSYLLTATDAIGCSNTSGPYVVGGSAAPTIDISNVAINSQSCTTVDGSITGLVVVGGSAPYTYDWNGNLSPTIDLVGVLSGTYILTVTDAAGCSVTQGPFNIPNANPPISFGLFPMTNDETCAGNDGSVENIFAFGGTGPLTYEWNGNPAGSDELFNIPAGSYTLVVTDAAGCSNTSGPHIVGGSSGPVVDVSAMVVTDAICSNDGAITGISISGGTVPYVFEWNGNPTVNQDLVNVSPGSYTLAVTDNAGCTTTSGPHVITSVAGPMIDENNLSITNETCFGNNGAITGLSVSGGMMPFLYEWNGNTTPTADLNGVNSNTYTLTVTDANGCSATSGPHVVDLDSSPFIDESNVIITDEICDGLNGEISGITISNGVAPYTFEWNGNPSVSSNLTGVPAGNYTLTVTDFNGCSVSSSGFTIGGNGLPTVDESSLTILDETCFGSVGSITGINISGGTLPYSFDWNSTASPTVELLNASSGSYTLTVTDGSGCIVTSGPHSIGLTPSPVIDLASVTVTPQSCAGNDGFITGINVTGGLAPYSYTWNGNNSISSDLIAVSDGNYTFTVTDANGCTNSAGPFVVTGTAAPVLDPTAVITQAESCFGNDGSITGITISGGLAPYSFDWNGNSSASIDLVNAVAGNYTLTVTDANNCAVSIGAYTLSNIGAPTIDNSIVNVMDESCAGNDGSVSGLIINGGTAPYNFEWNGNTTISQNLNNANAGSYTLLVTDAVGCSVTSGPYQIEGGAGPLLDDLALTVTDESCFGNDGSITGILVNGGTLPYIIDWNGNLSTSLDLLNVTSGTYSVTVTDALGCAVTSGPHVINGSSAPSIDLSNLSVLDENCGNADGNIQGILVTGGVLPYTFVYDNGIGSVATTDLTGIPAGDYVLTVTGADACSTSEIISVEENLGPNIDESNVSVTNADCENQGGAILGITASGFGQLSFEWTNSSLATRDAINVSSGSYQLTVSDANGCSVQSQVYEVSQNPGPTADFIILPENPTQGEEVTFVNQSTGYNTSLSSWYVEGDVYTINNLDYQFESAGNQVVQLVVSDEDGCKDSIEIALRIETNILFYAPNTFTPDNNEFNQTWNVSISGVDIYDYSLKIYNRWGKLVFESQNTEIGWDGTYAGDYLETGTYVWTIEAKNISDNERYFFTGHVNMLR